MKFIEKFYNNFRGHSREKCVYLYKCWLNFFVGLYWMIRRRIRNHVRTWYMDMHRAVDTTALWRGNLNISHKNRVIGEKESSGKQEFWGIEGTKSRKKVASLEDSCSTRISREEIHASKTMNKTLNIIWQIISIHIISQFDGWLITILPFKMFRHRNLRQAVHTICVFLFIPILFNFPLGISQVPLLLPCIFVLWITFRST